MSDLERALRTLSLPGSRMDRDRLMFLAGRASAQTVGRTLSPSEKPPDQRQVLPAGRTVARHPRTRWLWPATAVVSTCCAAVLALLLVLRDPPPSAAPRQIAAPDTGPERAPAEARGLEPLPIAAPDQHADAEPIPMAPPPQRQNRSAASIAASGLAGQRDGSRLPAYLELRRLVLEHGIEVLPLSRGTDRTREPVADARPEEPSRLLRAIDRPAHSAAGGDDRLDGIFLLPRGDNL